MYKLQPFQAYYTVLYVFGLNPFISFANMCETQSKIIIVYLPRFVYIIVNVYAIWNSPLHIHYTKSFFFFAHFRIAWDVSLNFIAICENLFNLNALHKILHTISFTINCFERHLKINFPFAMIKKSIERKLLLKLILFLFELISKFIIDPAANSDLKRTVFYDIFYMFTNLNLFHFIFYVEFVKYSFASVNEAIVQQINQGNTIWHYEYTKNCLRLLRHIKLIHFKLWRISHAINSLFGWFLNVLIANLITGFIFDVYFMHLYGRYSFCEQTCFWRKYHCVREVSISEM